MKKAIKFCLIATLSTTIISGCSFEGNNENVKGKEGEKVEVQKNAGKYTMPDEKDKHEGTWLQWPHEYTYGEEYKQEVEPIWVKMASALTEGEKVHIVAYDQEEKERINKLLTDEGLNMEKIDFFIAPTDDVWARDSGPIFVYDSNKNLKILDPAFNGWGKKTPYKNDAQIRKNVSKQSGIERIDWGNLSLKAAQLN